MLRRARRAALAEIRRVLRPDGRLLFLEHVRAGSPRMASWQDRLERPWGWAPPLTRPHVAGVARRG